MAKVMDRIPAQVGASLDVLKRQVVIQGMTPIMFDRYAGDNNTQLEVHQKLYFAHGTKNVCLPATNISSFLSGENTVSAPRRLLGKKARSVAQGCLSFVYIAPDMIPFRREGKPIIFGAFVNDVDPQSGIYIDRRVARLKNGVPNPKVRPVLPLPWELEFTVNLFPNADVKIEMVEKLFRDGGIALGLGTYRGVFGKFIVQSWQ